MSAFLAAVLALGGLAALEGLRHGMLSLSADFLLLMVFACVAAPHTLNLGHNARISTLQPFLLGAIVLFGVREAMLLAAVSMAYFWIVGRPRLHLHKGLFNLCNFVLSAWLGGHVYLLSGGQVGNVTSPESLVGLLLCVLTFFVVNTGLVSVAVGLEQKIDPFRVWYEKYSWTINSQLAGGSLVILIGLLRNHYGLQVFFLLVPFCIMSYHFYKAYFPRAVQKAHKT
jgi:MASE9 protein